MYNAQQQAALAVVKPGIDAAVQAIKTQLALFFPQPTAQIAPIHLAVAEAKRLVGVFKMVDMAGLASFCTELEQGLIELAVRPAQASVLHREIFTEALQDLQGYLVELTDGADNATLRLFPAYEKLQHLRGLEMSFEQDLFFPNTQVELPAVLLSNVVVSDAGTQLRSARSQYQQALARYLRHIDTPFALSEMHQALGKILPAIPADAGRGYWWVAQEFLACLMAGETASDIQLPRLMGRIDQHIRALIETREFALQPELNQMLFVLGHAPQTNAELSHTYQLSTYLPAPGTLAPAQLSKRLLVIGEQLASAEESLEHAATGDSAALTALCAQLVLIAQYCQLLDHASVKLLANSIAEYGKKLSNPDEQAALSLSLAVALLGLQRAVRDYRHLDEGFAEQASLLIADFELALQGRQLSEAQLLRFAELSSHSTRQDAMPPLAKALGENLQEVETVLTALFENAEQRDGLPKLPRLLAQVTGAMVMTAAPAAMQLSRDLQLAVNTILHSGNSLSLPESRALAQAVSSLASHCLTLTEARAADSENLLRASQDLRQQTVLLPNTVALVKASTLSASLPSNSNEDVELLEIFLEEAQEVLGIVQESLALSQLHPSVQSHLVTIRRGFHTLKGSGRMVGLTELGEVAWNVERAMNVWLKQETPASAQLNEMISMAIKQFGDWITQLQRTGNAHIHANELNALAAHIEDPLAVPATVVPVTVVPAVDLPVVVAPVSSVVVSAALPSVAAPQAVELPVAEAISTPEKAVKESGNTEQIQTSENLELEILEIFLEEAGEVLQNLQAFLAQAQAQPHDNAHFVNMRRSFHTLKGSGRMVGLTKLGEVAWNVERAMNAWLKLEHPPAELVFKMVGLAISSFSGWIASIQAKGAARIVADEINALAAQIETGELLTAASPAVIEAPLEFNLLDEVISPRAVEPEPEPDHQPLTIATSASPLSIAVASEAAADVEAEDDEPAAIKIGSVSVSPTLFSIGSEESKQNIVNLRNHFSNLISLDEPHIEYDFMRAAHTIVGVNRAMGFTPIMELASALEAWLMIRIEHAFELAPTQTQLIEQSIARLGLMVDQVAAQHYPDVAPELVQALHADKEQLKIVKPVAPVIVVQSTPAVPSEELAPQVQDEIDAQLLPIFLEEADELIPKIGEALRNWRAQPNDDEPVHLLNRLLHNAKGSARMAGAMRLGDVAHKLEDKVLTAGGLKHDANYWEQLDQGYDYICNLLEELRTGKPAIDPAQPSSVGQRSGDASPASSNVVRLEIGAERALQGNMLRVRADVLDRMVNEASEISVARSRMEAELRIFKDGLLELTNSVMRLRKQVREVEIQAETQMQARVSVAQDSAEQFDPLEFDRFTRLQELTRFLNESVHDVQTVQQTLLKNLDETAAAMSAQARLNRDLQQSLMNVRMVPFNSINDRLYRIVRQTSKQLGKRANLDLIGTGVEIDRSVLEKMTAPFEHLLRNAIAHGLENEAQREQAGKVPFGDIRLSVGQENNEVVFTLSDDGAGLDFAALRDKGIAKGLLPADDSSTEVELTQLIFSSGITTAAEVNEIAGRGIGMDVVRSEITGLGGRIDVQSTRGKGTQFVIHLPLTLAVAQVLMVHSNDATYAIPAAMVTQVQQIKAADMTTLYRTQQIDWQGVTYPLQYLPRLLDEQHPAAVIQARNTILLLKSGANVMALHIDELLGNQEAVVKNIGPQLSRLAGIAGATVRGDGAVVLILNPLQMQRRQHQAAQQQARPAAPVIAAASKVLVMVVDDSLTVRKITSRLLTRSGYEVVTAKDGMDAVEQLRDIHPAVMLVDVEMPRMDGFELTKEVRRTQATKDIPIIMITSRTADKHREHAMQLGVNAYLGKPYQEDDLLARIAGFVKEWRIQLRSATACVGLV
ncbi:MAG: Hpt domain-containing protein [Gallionella sp.]